MANQDFNDDSPQSMEEVQQSTNPIMPPNRHGWGPTGWSVGGWGIRLPPFGNGPIGPFQRFIKSAGRAANEWGTWDRHLHDASRYPGVPPGPYMPTNADIPRLINDVADHLHKNGSGNVAELAAKFGRFAGEFLKGYAQGQLARAKLAHEQMLGASKNISKTQKGESDELKRLWAAYGPHRKEDGSLDPGDHDALLSGIRQLATKNNDDLLWNLAAQGDTGAIERIVGGRDAAWLDNEKFLKVQEAQRRDDERRQKEQDAKAKSDRDEARKDEAAAEKKKAQQEKEDRARKLLEPYLKQPGDTPATPATPATPVTPETPAPKTTEPPATSEEDKGDDDSDVTTTPSDDWKPSLDRSEASPTTDVASLGDPSTDMTPTPRADDPDLRDWQRQQQRQRMLDPKAPPAIGPGPTITPEPDDQTPTSQFRYPQTASAGMSDAPDPGIQPVRTAQAGPAPANLPPTAGGPAAAAPAAPAPVSGADVQFNQRGLEEVDRQAHHLMEHGTIEGGAKNVAPEIVAAARARASQIQAGLNRIATTMPKCKLDDKACEDLVLDQIRKVDPWWADMTKQWVHGSLPAPRSYNALKEPYATLTRLGGVIDPTFDQHTSETRGKTLKEYTSGAQGRNMVSVATAYRHLKDNLALLGHYDANGKWVDNPDRPGDWVTMGASIAGGTKWAPGMTPANKQWWGDWTNSLETAATEYTRALTQGVPRQTQLSREIGEMNYNLQDAATIRANIESKMRKLQARLDTLEEGFTAGTGRQPEAMYKQFNEWSALGKSYKPIKGDELGATRAPNEEANSDLAAMHRDKLSGHWNPDANATPGDRHDVAPRRPHVDIGPLGGVPPEGKVPIPQGWDIQVH